MGSRSRLHCRYCYVISYVISRASGVQMREAFEDPVKGIEIMERMQLCHDLLTELRKQIKVIETDYFSLIGEEFGDLTVHHKSSKLEIINGTETHFACWKCYCTCGAECLVEHSKLIDKTITNCGGESHSEFVKI